MKADYIQINECSRGGVLALFNTFGWEVNFLQSSLHETEHFDEDNQSMLMKKYFHYTVHTEDKCLFEFSVMTSPDVEMNKYQAIDLVKEEILKNNSFYLGDYYFEYILTQMIDSIDLDINKIEEKLVELDAVNIKSEELEEDRDFNSITWTNRYTFDFEKKKYSLYVYGTAIAEISYDRWVDSFGYNISSWDLDEIK